MSEKHGLPSLLDRHWAESALAIGAVIIAAVSLWVAYDAERTNRELVASERQLVEANSWPYVQQGYSDTTLAGQAIERVDLSNGGIGPAKIETVEVFWRGTPYHTWRELLQACCGYTPQLSQDPASRFFTSGAMDRVLRAGETIHLLWYPKSPLDAQSWAKAQAAVPTLRLRICYCSVFNQCWLSEGSTIEPPRVKVCPRAKVQMGG